MKSQLQEQADRCREAQLNLENANTERLRVQKILEDRMNAVAKAKRELAEVSAQYDEVALIWRYAADAVRLHVSNMRGIVDKVDPYGAQAIVCGENMEGR